MFCHLLCLCCVLLCNRHYCQVLASFAYLRHERNERSNDCFAIFPNMKRHERNELMAPFIAIFSKV